MKRNYLCNIFFGFTCAFQLTACNPIDESASLSSYPKNGACAIDTPQQSAILSKDQDFAVGGWAYDKAGNSVPQNLTLYFVNESSKKMVPVSAQRGTKREDVAKAYSNDALVDSGFDAVVKMNLLEPGTYKIIILQSNTDGGAIVCSGEEQKITIK